MEVKRKLFYWLDISNFLYIIVLLILAGVSITVLFGDDGLLKMAQKAKVSTDEATEKDNLGIAIIEAQTAKNTYEDLDQIDLQNVLDGQFGVDKTVSVDNGDGTFSITVMDSMKSYKLTSNGIEDDIDWNEAMANVEAPASQDEERNTNVIGIGTDGNAVDMDLWQYTLMEDGTYGLNDKDGLDASGESGRSAGYVGNFNEDGSIIGTIPTYISTNNGKNYVPVTNLVHTFYNTEIKIAPKIPHTIKDLNLAFYKCANLISASNIPSNVTSMCFTFSQCTALTSMPKIGNKIELFYYTFSEDTNLENLSNLPDSIVDMQCTFSSCTKLKVAPELPMNVENISGTFMGCTSLVKAPSVIPEKATDMTSTFQNCTKLEEIQFTIPNNVNSMSSTFYGCALKNISLKIPESVKNLSGAFWNCKNLSGTIEINAQPTDYRDCFTNAAIAEGAQLKLTGTCNVLNELKMQGGNIN